MNKKILTGLMLLVSVSATACGGSKVGISSKEVSEKGSESATSSVVVSSEVASSTTVSSEVVSSTTVSSEVVSSSDKSTDTSSSSVVSSEVVSSTSSTSEDVAEHTIYIKGGFNGWQNEALTYVANGLYEIKNLNVKTTGCEFGFVDENEKWYGNPDANNSNFKFSTTGIFDIEFKFTSDTTYAVTEKLVEEILPESPYETEWYVRGTLNSWGADEEHKLTAVEGKEYTYAITLELEKGAQFKIATSDWSKEFNYSSIVENEVKANFKLDGGNIGVVNEGTYTLTISCPDNTLTITM